MALMFIGPFSVYVGALLGARRVLLYAGTVFIACSLLLPFSPSLRVMLCLQVLSGLSSGTFYPLTLTYALRALPIRYVIYGIGVYAMDTVGATSVGTPLVAWYTEHRRGIDLWQSALLTPLMMPAFPLQSRTHPNATQAGLSGEGSFMAAWDYA
jgi:DHA2 family multidrug resistance protein